MGNHLPATYAQPPANPHELQVPRTAITQIEQLGQGFFGEVWKAKYNGVIEVAVKMLRADLRNQVMSWTDSDLTTEMANQSKRFLKEAEVMFELRHPKLVQLLGVCTEQEPYYIITEWVPQPFYKYLYQNCTSNYSTNIYTKTVQTSILQNYYTKNCTNIYTTTVQISINYKYIYLN